MQILTQVLLLLSILIAGSGCSRDEKPHSKRIERAPASITPEEQRQLDLEAQKEKSND